MKPDPPWQPAPAALAPIPEEVHVWRVWLDRPAASVDSLAATLAADERERADRFLHADLRRRFVVGRGALRSILSRYLGRPPAAIRFEYGRQGKPALADDRGLSPLGFNLSHSHELALCAVALGREVGVDVERERTVANLSQIAERFFSRSERLALHALPPTDQTRAFFTCWTRKEAYIKARGEGLRIPLDAFDVTLLPDEPAHLLATRHDPGDVHRWSLRELEPGPGYVGALAVEGESWQIRCWEWQ
jgi:4'-phosphopantetheinyl transferase